MRTRTALLVVAALLAAFTFMPNLHAQPLVTIETVTVGDPGNAADSLTGYGAVNYEFNIGKYEATIGQYTTFLNAAAKTDPYGLYNEFMFSGSGYSMNIAGILRNGSPGSYAYTPVGPYGITLPGADSPESRPIVFVSWFNAARFANWLHNGANDEASTENGAYALNGVTNGSAPAKNLDAKWWIPSEDEWYKAAYYKGGGTNAGYWLYPTQSDSTPGNTIGSASNQANFQRNNGTNFVYAVTQANSRDSDQNFLTDAGAFSGSPSAYGTFDQGGNVIELNSLSGAGGTNVGKRGGNWFVSQGDMQSFTRYDFNSPDQGSFLTGFRLATVPEPSTYALLLMTGAGALWLARRKR